MPLFDLHTGLLILAISAAGGLVGLDRTAAGQFMISQPIVAGPLTGWLLGNAEAGLIIGAVLELVWVLDMPIGTFVPADATIGAVSATAIAVLGGSTEQVPLDRIGFSLLLTTGMVPITMMVDEGMRKRNSVLAETALAAPDQHLDCRLTRSHLSGLGAFFLKSFVLCLLFIPAGLAAVAIFAHAPDRLHRAMALFVKWLPLLGGALILQKLSVSIVNRFLLAGFAVALMMTLLLRGQPVVIVLLVLATGFLGARYGAWR
jgi:PTS system mannose-specific IIC component